MSNVNGQMEAMRENAELRARLDECAEIAKAPLLRLIEEQAAEIAILHSANADYRRRLDLAKLAAGAGAGEVAGE